METKNTRYSEVHYYFTAHKKDRYMIAVNIKCDEKEYLKLIDTFIDEGFKVKKSSALDWNVYVENQDDNLKCFVLNKENMKNFFEIV